MRIFLSQWLCIVALQNTTASSIPSNTHETDEETSLWFQDITRLATMSFDPTKSPTATPSEKPSSEPFDLDLTLSCLANDNVTACKYIERPEEQCVNNAILSFTYNSRTCDGFTSSKQSRYACTDKTNIVHSEEVRVTCVNEGVVFCNCSVKEDGRVMIASLNQILPDTLTCTISDIDDGTAFQEFTFDPSGDTDMKLKDVFGSLTLESCEDDDGNKNTCLVDANYSYQVNNTGQNRVIITDFWRFCPPNNTLFFDEDFVAQGGGTIILNPGNSIIAKETSVIDSCRTEDIAKTVYVNALSTTGAQYGAYASITIPAPPTSQPSLSPTNTSARPTAAPPSTSAPPSSSPDVITDRNQTDSLTSLTPNNCTELMECPMGEIRMIPCCDGLEPCNKDWFKNDMPHYRCVYQCNMTLSSISDPPSVLATPEVVGAPQTPELVAPPIPEVAPPTPIEPPPTPIEPPPTPATPSPSHVTSVLMETPQPSISFHPTSTSCTVAEQDPNLTGVGVECCDELVQCRGQWTSNAMVYDLCLQSCPSATPPYAPSMPGKGKGKGKGKSKSKSKSKKGGKGKVGNSFGSKKGQGGKGAQPKIDDNNASPNKGKGKGGKGTSNTDGVDTPAPTSAHSKTPTMSNMPLTSERPIGSLVIPPSAPIEIDSDTQSSSPSTEPSKITSYVPDTLGKGGGKPRGKGKGGIISGSKKGKGKRRNGANTRISTGLINATSPKEKVKQGGIAELFGTETLLHEGLKPARTETTAFQKVPENEKNGKSSRNFVLVTATLLSFVLIGFVGLHRHSVKFRGRRTKRKVDPGKINLAVGERDDGEDQHPDVNLCESKYCIICQYRCKPTSLLTA